MKRTIKLSIALVCVLALLLSFTACTKAVVQTDTAVVVTATAAQLKKMSGEKLVDYLAVLDDDFTYEAKDGMIITINGRTADSAKGEYWLIYTDDPDNGNEAWGTYEYDGKQYKSAIYGIQQLPVKEGYTYIFAISTF